MFVWIWEKVRVLIGDTLDLSDEYIMLYVEQAYHEACGICNVDNLPEESITSIAFLCASNIIAESNRNIQSLSEGGRNVSFGNLNGQQLREKALKGLDKWKKIKTI